MIEFHDPRAQPGAPIEPYDLELELRAGVTIGLLANGFPDSERFLDRLAEALTEQLADSVPDLKILRYNKGNASVVAGDQMLGGMSAECHAVVTAYGH